MSYEKCNRISLDRKNNKIYMNLASNNVFPLSYDNVEVYKHIDNFDDKLLNVFEDLQQGSIQISSINNNTVNFEYAMIKVREYLKENNIDSYEDLYKNISKVFSTILEKEHNILIKEDYKAYCEFSQNNSDIIRDIDLRVSKEIYGNAFKVFKNALEEKHDDLYIVQYENVYISKLGNYKGYYSKFAYTSNINNAKVFNYKNAYIVVNNFVGYKLEIIKK